MINIYIYLIFIYIIIVMLHLNNKHILIRHSDLFSLIIHLVHFLSKSSQLPNCKILHSLSHPENIV